VKSQTKMRARARALLPAAPPMSPAHGLPPTRATIARSVTSPAAHDHARSGQERGRRRRRGFWPSGLRARGTGELGSRWVSDASVDVGR
jgi:hypothetical protein